MARRRKNAGLAEVLVVLPWWVGVGLGVVGFVVLRWIFPSMLPPLLKSAAPSLHMLSWFPLVIFGFLGLISFVRSAMSSQGQVLLQVLDLPAKSSASHRKQRVEPSVNATPSNHAGWGHAAAQTDATAKDQKAYDAWTIEGLRELEWKRFELLCAKYYEAVGFKSETIRCGADGGIDVKLFKTDPNKPIAIVQCKAWNSGPVGVKEVRELLGIMAHEKVGRGVFITTGSYSKDALSFGAANPIQLLDGAGFIKKIQELAKDKQDGLLKFAFGGDYTTPTCASCGIKMVKRDSKRGAFWGCLNYPKCKSTFTAKS